MWQGTLQWHEGRSHRCAGVMEMSWTDPCPHWQSPPSPPVCYLSAVLEFSGQWSRLCHTEGARASGTGPLVPVFPEPRRGPPGRATPRRAAAPTRWASGPPRHRGPLMNLRASGEGGTAGGPPGGPPVDWGPCPRAQVPRQRRPDRLASCALSQARTRRYVLLIAAGRHARSPQGHLVLN